MNNQRINFLVLVFCLLQRTIIQCVYTTQPPFTTNLANAIASKNPCGGQLSSQYAGANPIPYTCTPYAELDSAGNTVNQQNINLQPPLRIILN